MDKTYPSRRSLIVCWAIMMSMTGVALGASEPASAARLSLLTIIVLLTVTGIKAAQILWVFLNLQASTGTWKMVFVAFLLLIFSIVLSCAGMSGYWEK